MADVLFNKEKGHIALFLTGSSTAVLGNFNFTKFHVYCAIPIFRMREK